jgi:hypothetical protein
MLSHSAASSFVVIPTSAARVSKVGRNLLVVVRMVRKTLRTFSLERESREPGKPDRAPEGFCIALLEHAVEAAESVTARVDYGLSEGSGIERAYPE